MTRPAPRIPRPGISSPAPGGDPAPDTRPADTGAGLPSAAGTSHTGLGSAASRPAAAAGPGTAYGCGAPQQAAINAPRSATTGRTRPDEPPPGARPDPDRGTDAPAGTAGTALNRPAHPRARPRHRAFRDRSGPLLMLADSAAVLAGTATAAALSTAGDALRCGALALGLLLVGCRQAGLYRPGFAPGALREVPAIGLRAALAWGFTLAVLGNGAGREAVAAAAAVTVTVACSLRAAAYGLWRAGARRDPGSTLIVGAGPAVRQIAAALQAHPEYGMLPVGVVAAGPGTETADPPPRQPAADRTPEAPLPILAGHGEITRAVIQNAVRHAVVVVGPQALDSRTTAAVRLLAAHGCRTWQVSTARGRATPDHLWGFACRRLEPAPDGVPGTRGLRAKRALDAAVSGLALLCLSPVLAACALAVRLADGPGVLFRQERIGLGGRPFMLLKFRTLRPGDERESATRWNIAHDRRMSGVGRLLRRTSLDELPQLWNVLRGDMSLVGPRPERPYFVQQFSTAHPGYQERHRMPAGITGLAQIHGLRGDTSIADRARFDNHYIDSWSLWQDIAILVRTACSVFRFGGS